MIGRLDMLIAHPDDEVIFGWPAILSARRIVAIASDAFNQDRAWCARRSEALKEVGDLIGVETICLNFNSEFYRRTTRDGKLWDMTLEVQAALGSGGGLPLFTHNAWGEYGHLDHILTHQIARMTGRRLIVTDMVASANWMPVTGYPQGQVIDEPREMSREEEELYDKAEAIYKKLGCWTWSQPPIRKAGLLCA